MQQTTERRAVQCFRIVVNGHAYAGTYSVHGPMLWVETLLLGAKRAQLGENPPEVLAKLLLAELVYEHERPRGP
jgi:hypothetical protein